MSQIQNLIDINKLFSVYEKVTGKAEKREEFIKAMLRLKELTNIEFKTTEADKYWWVSYGDYLYEELLRDIIRKHDKELFDKLAEIEEYFNDTPIRIIVTTRKPKEDIIKKDEIEGRFLAWYVKGLLKILAETLSKDVQRIRFDDFREYYVIEIDNNIYLGVRDSDC